MLEYPIRQIRNQLTRSDKFHLRGQLDLLLQKQEIHDGKQRARSVLVLSYYRQRWSLEFDPLDVIDALLILIIVWRSSRHNCHTRIRQSRHVIDTSIWTFHQIFGQLWFIDLDFGMLCSRRSYRYWADWWNDGRRGVHYRFNMAAIWVLGLRFRNKRIVCSGCFCDRITAILNCNRNLKTIND